MNDYTILGFLGDGKFARVYKAFHKIEHVNVALKVIKFRDDDDRYMIRDEIMIHELVQHESIVKLYGYFPFLNNKFTIIMEYVEGQELFDVIEKNNLDDQTIQSYFYQMLNAIMYLQTINIIHRDIKPENILITKSNKVKLSDFGLAKKLDNIREQTCSTWCGTTEYLAPEIVEGYDYNYKIDNWALGILLYELITKRTPFESEKRKKTLRKITKCNYYKNVTRNQLFQKIFHLLIVLNPKHRSELSKIKSLFTSSDDITEDATKEDATKENATEENVVEENVAEEEE